MIKEICRINTLNKRKSIIILMVLLFITFITLYIYRPYIYSNNIFDYSLANSLPSLLNTLIIYKVIYCLNKSIEKNNVDKILLMFAVPIGCILSELIQKTLYLGTYDFNDIIFIILSIPVIFLLEKFNWLLLWIIFKLIGNKF